MRKVRFLNNGPSVLKGFSLFEILRSLVLEAQINFETKLEKDTNSGCIGGSILDLKLMKHQSPNPFKNEVGLELVSGSIFGRS